MLTQESVKALIALIDGEIANMELRDRDDAFRLARLAHAHAELLALTAPRRSARVLPLRAAR